MPRTRMEFDQAEDSEFASQSELNTVKENTNTGLFVPATMNNYDLYQRILSGSKAGNDCNISMHNAKDRTDYFRCNSSTYQIFATIIYRGTNIWTPTICYAIVSGTAAGTSGQIRVWDLTNSRSVCEFAIFTGTAKRIISIAVPVGNLPASNAIFDLQIKASVDEARVHASGLFVS